MLLVLGWYDHRLVRGIEKFAQEQGWRLSQDLAREKVIPWGREGDGILAWLGAGNDLADFVRQAALPKRHCTFFKLNCLTSGQSALSIPAKYSIL